MFSIGPESRIASEIADELRAMVTRALNTTPSRDEQQLVQLGGQVSHVLLGMVDGEHLLDYQLYGSRDPATGELTFNLSFRARPTRRVSRNDPAPEWDPSVGPLALRDERDERVQDDAATPSRAAR